MRHLPGFALLSLVLATPAWADEWIYFAERGPVRLRITPLLDGQNPQARIDRYIQQLFAYTDRNHDGSLDAKEARLLPPWPRQLGDFFARPRLNFTAGFIPFAELDTDKDGQATLAEVQAHAVRAEFVPLSWHAGPTPPRVPDTTQVLWMALDTNRDGVVNAAELATAPVVLAKFDRDQDELLSTSELLQEVQAQFAFLAAPRAATTRPLSDEWFRVPALASAVPTLQRRRWTPAEVRTLDRDGNSQLDAAELTAWLTGPADVVGTLAVGPLQSTLGGVLNRALPFKATLPVGFALQPTRTVPKTIVRADEIYWLTPGLLWTGRLTTENSFALSQERIPGIYRDFVQIAGKADHVTKAQLGPASVLPQVAALFDAADHNGDGQLTRAELQTFVDLIMLGLSAPLFIDVADAGTSLFDLLDRNHDGVLSRRELNAAPKLLADHDRHRAGQLTRADLPRLLTLTARQGVALNPDNRPTPVAPQLAPALPAPTRGPVWFRIMDRNRDGDVSPREFVGPLRVFQQIDTDGDGLLDATEAEAHRPADKP